MMVDKVVALLDSMTLEELEKLPPARMRKFAELCRHWQQLAERRLRQQPKSGVLSDLQRGHRQE